MLSNGYMKLCMEKRRILRKQLALEPDRDEDRRVCRTVFKTLVKTLVYQNEKSIQKEET